MPPRHISPQSFDDILRELGDDPAIPDPHGIRKTPSPPKVDTPPQNKTSKPAFSAKSFELKGLTFNSLWLFGVLLLLCGGGFFFYFDNNKSVDVLEISTLQNQLLALKEEFEFSQTEWASEKKDLYQSMEEIEVSIHLIDIQQPTQSSQSKPAVIPYEADLRRWRYLGITRMGVAEQAFFHTGNSTKMVLKGYTALGEWRLSQAEKELAVLTHPKGKSITFKSTQSE